MKLSKDQELLDAAQFAINSIERDDAVAQRMAAYGFDANRVREGKEKMVDAVRSQQEKDKHYNIQWELSQQISEQLSAVQDQFREHVRVVRIALRKEPTALHTLKVDKLAGKGWPCVRQADHFYSELRKQKRSLDAYGVTAKEIQRASSETTALLALRGERLRQKGLAENSTMAKRSAFAELRTWVTECRSVARLALKKDPQLMEGFGMTVRA